MNPFAVVAILALVAATVFVFYKIHYTKKNGIETVGTITRIEDESMGEGQWSYYGLRHGSLRNGSDSHFPICPEPRADDYYGRRKRQGELGRR